MNIAAHSSSTGYSYSSSSSGTRTRGAKEVWQRVVYGVCGGEGVVGTHVEALGEQAA